MTFTVAIIGRPNVGKSTLFNKLVGKRVAIVSDYCGVTRDRKIEKAHLGPIEFDVIDTSGLEQYQLLKNRQLEKKMMEQTEKAICDADLCLFLVDAQTGVLPADEYFSKQIKKRNIPVVLVVNKCDSVKSVYSDSDFYKLGLGVPVFISSEHNNGFNLLYEAIEPFYDKYIEDSKNYQSSIDLLSSDSVDSSDIIITILGRPNVGKSTLINAIVGNDRVITSDIAGTTRDSISIKWKHKGRCIKLVDTAGIKKKRNISTEMEKLSVFDSMKSVKFSQIVVLMLDATDPFNEQDMSISNLVVKEGRGLVFALNKWDTVKDKDKHKLMNDLISFLQEKVSQVKGCQIIPISALYSNNINKLLDACIVSYNEWNALIETSKLNNWLKDVEKDHTPPLFNGRTVRLKYITQLKSRPPRFLLFTNNIEKLQKTSYDKFLLNRLRKDFNLTHTPIRLDFKKSENPYAKK